MLLESVVPVPRVLNQRSRTAQVGQEVGLVKIRPGSPGQEVGLGKIRPGSPGQEVGLGKIRPGSPSSSGHRRPGRLLL